MTEVVDNGGDRHAELGAAVYAIKVAPHREVREEQALARSCQCLRMVVDHGCRRVSPVLCYYS